MADEQQELRRVNWTEVLSFTHIFKSFKMAIHPSKLLLAMAGIILVFVSGFALDALWGLGGQTVFEGEIARHATSPASGQGGFDEWIEGLQKSRPLAAANLAADAKVQRYSLRAYASGMAGGPSPYFMQAFDEALEKDRQGEQRPAPDVSGLEKRAKDKGWADVLGDAEDDFSEELSRIDEVLDSADELAEDKIKKDTSLNEEKREEAYEKLSEHWDLAQQAITARKLAFARQVAQIEGKGIFRSFLTYQWGNARSAIASVLQGNITGGLTQYRQDMSRRGIQPATTDEAALPPIAPNDRPGFIVYVLRAWQGVMWLICRHWVYAILFGVLCLATVALFGGAIHRIAALHFAREEKISMGQALRFSASKFLSYLTAPLIPLALIVFLGLLISLGGVLFGWYAGGILMGLLFFLAIILGLIIAFLLIGLVAGLPLMYPTIAVEGSDSFDAISRSFSYVFAKPWRAILYGLVALIYGAITYVFVRLFAFLALRAVHFFVGWGVFGGGDRLSPDADKLDVLWTRPEFDDLFGRFSWAAMGGAEPIGAFLIGIWVFLVAAAVAAFLLTYLASATTAIYYLLRQKVDATDLDDVYVEEPEEEALAAEPVGETPAEEAPAEEAKEQPPAEEAGEAEESEEESDQK